MNKQYTFYKPPKKNIKFQFGEITDTYIFCYVSKPPNAFKRWMFKIFLGIYIEVQND